MSDQANSNIWLEPSPKIFMLRQIFGLGRAINTPCNQKCQVVVGLLVGLGQFYYPHKTQPNPKTKKKVKKN